MNLIAKGFKFPSTIAFDEDTLSDTYGKLVAEPLERGYGTTIGNSLRRLLLSSIEGAAITHIRIPGVLHEFQTIKGVKEDMVDIVLNLKKLRFRLQGDKKRVAKINVTGPKDVTGADIECEANLEVLTPEQHIATVDDGAVFQAELIVKKGFGYSPSEANKEKNQPIDLISVDALFNPIKRVNMQVEKARVGRSTDYDRLVMEIWTDGSITPQKAVSRASELLIEHFNLFVLDENDEDVEEEEGNGNGSEVLEGDFNRNLLKSVEELELSVRSYNCLKNANISTVADLVQKTEHEMLKTKNFGRKSLDEIKGILNKMGLDFGMEIDESLLEQYRAEGGK
ncbi:MAG: DNA-directed RNA polymerase subunit alpha [Nitrospirae bacterium]|nr:MAG: DNA-directed RNA polymerase subunit alpha [Nitrospirota bacterium]